MDHESLKELIFELYDGELNDSARHEAEAHLTVCMECKEMFTGWSKSAQLLFRDSKPVPSEFFVRRVMSRIHDLETPKPQLRRSWSLGWLVAPSFAVVMALFLFALMPGMPSLSTDALVMNSRTDAVSQWMFSMEPTKTDDVLGFVMEDAS